MAAPEAAELSNPQNYKTCVLRVSIHCEGCKKKVKKILNSVPGVYAIDIDIRQHKVAVTGNVDAETLLWKLKRAGKIAELWPEPAQPIQNNVVKPVNNKVKAKDPEENIANSISEEKPPETVGSSGSTSESNGASAKIVDVETKSRASGGKTVIESKDERAAEESKESKSEEKKPVVASKSEEKKPTIELNVEGKVAETGATGKHSAQAVSEDKAGEAENVSKNIGNGGEGKKKKKKGQNGNTSNVEAGESSRSAESAPRHQTPPRQQAYQYPPQYYYGPPEPPVQVLSYNTAHPSSVQTASYYASPTPYSYAYAYSGSGVEHEYQPSEFEYYQRRQPLDSFEMFSDENPNGCAVM